MRLPTKAIVITLALAGCIQAEDADAAASAPVHDVYSVGEDGPVAEIAGETILWSDFARYLIRSWGTNGAWGHSNQLTYSANLRHKLKELGIQVTQADIERELVRAWKNSTRNDSSNKATSTLADYLGHMEVQTGKSVQAFTKYIWGYAAQSTIVDHLWPLERRIELYEAGEGNLYASGYEAAHILSQSLGGKRSTEEARARIDAAHARLAAGEDWNAVCWEVSDDFRSLARNMGRPESVSEGGVAEYSLGLLQEWKDGACPFGETMTLAAKGLEPGGISEVFESPWGFHIIRLVAAKPKPTFEEVEYRIHGALSAQLLQESREKSETVYHVFGKGDWTLEPFAHEDAVVAEVDGEKLMLSDFGRLMYLNAGPREGARFRIRMLEEAALRLKAKELGITVTPEEVEAELEKQFQAVRAGNKTSAADVDSWIRSRHERTHLSPSQTRVNMAARMLRLRTADALASPEAVAEYYHANPLRFGAVYRTRSIMIYYYSGKRTQAEARELTLKIRDKIEAARASLPPERVAKADEEYFKVFVERYSEHPIAKRNGGFHNAWSPGPDGASGTSGLNPSDLPTRTDVGFEQAAVETGLGGLGFAEIPGGYAVFEVVEFEPAPTEAEAADKIRVDLKTYAGRLALEQTPHTLVPRLLGIDP